MEGSEKSMDKTMPFRTKHLTIVVKKVKKVKKSESLSFKKLCE
jgi:hypothetical protein